MWLLDCKVHEGRIASLISASTMAHSLYKHIHSNIFWIKQWCSTTVPKHHTTIHSLSLFLLFTDSRNPEADKQLVTIKAQDNCPATNVQRASHSVAPKWGKYKTTGNAGCGKNRNNRKCAWNLNVWWLPFLQKEMRIPEAMLKDSGWSERVEFINTQVINTFALKMKNGGICKGYFKWQLHCGTVVL